jgi:hypothetical protein
MPQAGAPPDLGDDVAQLARLRVLEEIELVVQHRLGGTHPHGGGEAAGLQRAHGLVAAAVVQLDGAAIVDQVREREAAKALVDVMLQVVDRVLVVEVQPLDASLEADAGLKLRRRRQRGRKGHGLDAEDDRAHSTSTKGGQRPLKASAGLCADGVAGDGRNGGANHAAEAVEVARRRRRDGDVILDDGVGGLADGAPHMAQGPQGMKNVFVSRAFLEAGDHRAEVGAEVFVCRDVLARRR